MDLCYESGLPGRSVAFHGKNSNIEHYTQTVKPNVFVPTMLLGTVDFYHFILFSLTLTLPGGHKVSAKRNLLALFSRTRFI